MAAQAQQSTALLRKPPNTMQHIVHDSNFTIENHVILELTNFYDKDSHTWLETQIIQPNL